MSVGDFGALGEIGAVFEEAVAEGGEEFVGRDLGLGARRVGDEAEGEEEAGGDGGTRDGALGG